ncbi:hypothetical protein MAFF241647_14830 [Ralstonia solanacearum]|uniref:DUF695 domain-containing protein n=1 Tax=Ralstonia pseudosolanacearum TaxID=1310165 RepID=UPI0018A497EB|nr:DUF695 domain-containing protein [Ralstonia pseudosolanacearum]MDO3517727.1 DUF695 domain-containing protein [Ralstonia pseudosolanacearum]MDO3541012.1 DUF695 domain-containing protein [Ralstonia pseudosolanacearum]BCM07126.1 hypothetical protein MAFF241647_14830 [Ralstonia solanacearum]
MADAWETFPAQMGDYRAFIAFNDSYAQIARTDPRTSLFRVRVAFKHPTPEGMPPEGEFPELRNVLNLLSAAVAAEGGIHVGRLTAKGCRHFYFYVALSEEKVLDIFDSVAAQTPYELAYAYQEDPDKGGYWKNLYPTADDWQMIRDIRVLDALKDKGDISDVTRPVSHWAYFPGQNEAQQFADWASENRYNVHAVAVTDDKKVEVRFTHDGTMELEEITHHTIIINRQARALGGNYDGWETRVANMRIESDG